MKRQNRQPSTIRHTIDGFVRLTLVAATLVLNQPAEAASWTNAGSLKTATLFHTSTLLPNGRVLVAGGQAASGVTNRAELFDPVTGAWSPTAALSTNRLAHTATLLRNGKVLVAGGWARSGFTNALDSAELYDPATGLWTNTGSMITPRAYHRAILLPSGKVLVTGGGLHSFALLNSAEVYDPSTGIWTATGAMSTNRVAFATALLPNGRVLAAGGSPDTDAALRTAEVYDPSTGLWTLTGSMTHQRADFTMTVLSNGKVLAIGGWGDNPDLPPNTEVYDPTNETWAVSGVLNVPRYHICATLMQDGRVLAAGGEVYDTAFSSSELFDPSTGTWANSDPLITPRRLHSMTLLPNGDVLVVGGVNTNFLSSAELYHSSSGTLTPVILTGMAKTPGGPFRFGFTNVPISGAAFTVYSSTNPVSPLSNWTARGGVMEILPGQFQFSDAQAANNTQNFYSVRSP